MLLERDSTLDALAQAVADAAAGRGSVALVTGEAGIGKTSLVRAFAGRARARVLFAACDDLMAPRTLGPLRDAALGSAGPLAAALADGQAVDGVFAAAAGGAGRGRADRPRGRGHPLGRRRHARRARLRGAADRAASARCSCSLPRRGDRPAVPRPARGLPACTGSRSAPLSREAVGALAAGTAADADARAPRDARQPVLRHRGAGLAAATRCPRSVVEAVLARRRPARRRPAATRSTSSPSCRRTCGWTSSIALLGPRFEALAEAEVAGVLEVRDHGVAFRHELARRAIEHSLPGHPAPAAQRGGGGGAARRRAAGPRPAHAPRGRGARRRDHRRRRAGRGARGGARPAPTGRRWRTSSPFCAHLGPARAARARRRARRLRLGAVQRAPLPGGGGGRRARRPSCYARAGDPVAHGQCLVRLSRHLFMAGETDAAEASGERAVLVLRADRRRAGARPRVALRGCDPGHDRRAAARGGHPRARRGGWRCGPAARTWRRCA